MPAGGRSPAAEPGHPYHSDVLAALLNDIGIPAGRTAAIRQYVLEMPAPAVAEALSDHRVTTAKLASEAGGTWSRYASDDHLVVTTGLDTTEHCLDLPSAD
ncbi:hypothetical protein [Streptomyces sp. NPDC096033]|uniref:hypothetical protein n=1 Tax=Streptomyces sp. NPDC096033 TaxID=3366071 RepID=UPI003814B88A